MHNFGHTAVFDCFRGKLGLVRVRFIYILKCKFLVGVEAEVTGHTLNTISIEDSIEDPITCLACLNICFQLLFLYYIFCSIWAVKSNDIAK